jgi:ubiquinone/menaquinone biosynthesis C-methylase UbiE
MAAGPMTKALTWLRQLRRRLLLTAFYLLYNQFAWAYEVVSWLVSLGRWRAWGERALPFLHGPRILELGHGPGHLLAAMGSRGLWSVGLDASANMGNMARGRLLQRGQLVRLVRGRGQLLPFAPASFDSVVAAFPAPYILASETIDAIRRVLRPGGRLVIVPEAALTGSGLFARAIDRLFILTGQRETGREKLQQADAPFWVTPLTAAGFLVKVHYIHLPDSLVKVMVAELGDNK